MVQAPSRRSLAWNKIGHLEIYSRLNFLEGLFQCTCRCRQALCQSLSVSAPKALVQTQPELSHPSSLQTQTVLPPGPLEPDLLSALPGYFNGIASFLRVYLDLLRYSLFYSVLYMGDEIHWWDRASRHRSDPGKTPLFAGRWEKKKTCHINPIGHSCRALCLKRCHLNKDVKIIQRNI